MLSPFCLASSAAKMIKGSPYWTFKVYRDPEPWEGKMARKPSASAKDGEQKTMAINIGGSEQIVTGQAGSGWLVPLEGPQTGELFQLRAGRTLVGTSPDCDIVLRDPSISGRHAEISTARRGFRINDLGSTNGTYVNDKRISSEDLIDNDSVRLGRTNL